MEVLSALATSLRQGNSGETRRNAVKALAAGHDYKEILEVMLKVMEDVGKKFKENELFVPEVLVIGRSFNTALDVIAPIIEENDESKGLVIIGTVQGDLHDIGKNLVKMLITGTGAKVIDLGVDVSPKMFVEAVEKYKPDIVAMSALLTTTMVQINQTIKELNKAGLRDQVKILIGGAPVTKHYADNVEADFYSADAGSAADLVRQIINKKIQN